MSRSRKDILETESMLTRLTNLLVQHRKPEASPYLGFRADAEQLRRISITLQRWHELECNGNIARGHKKNGAFEWNDAGKPYWCSTQDNTPRWAIPDRERGARNRLARILRNYPALTAYVQTDPRGCALYILKPGDVPDGADASSYYSRGLAVHR